jgi:hypothetical protein
MLQPPGSILDMINGPATMCAVSASRLRFFGNLLIRKGSNPQTTSFSLSQAGNLGMLFAEAKTK